MLSRSVYIPTLNGWRAIAISLVLAAHSVPMLLNSGTRFGYLSAQLFSHGGIGVDIFFAISGYLICSLLLQEKDKTGQIDLFGFYTKRSFRILPPLFFYLSVIALLKIGSVLPMVSAGELISSAFFVRNYFGWGSWYTGHFWSLAVEEHFYLFVPVMLASLRWKTGLQTALGIVVCCALIRLFEANVTDLKVEFRTEARLDAIMYGVIAALLVFRFKPAIEKHLTGRVVIGAVLASVFVCYLFPYMPIRRTAIAMMSPWIIVFTALHSENIISKILELRPIQWIGKLSYSIYIWQSLFLVPEDRSMPFLQSFPFAFFAIFVCSSISYYLIEKPSIRAGHVLAKQFEPVSMSSDLAVSQSPATPDRYP